MNANTNQENQYTFHNHLTAMIQADKLANVLGKTVVVGMDYGTGKFHVIENPSAEMLEEIAEENPEIGQFLNCIAVHPSKD